MSLRTRYRLLRLRRLAIYSLAGVLVLVALLVGTLSQLLPLAQRHPEHIAAWLSQRAGQPVRFDALDTAWTRRGPLLRLDGLRVGPGEGVQIGQAEVLVSLYAGLLPGSSFTELRLRGTSLTLLRAEDGRWSVRGLPASSSSDPLETLRRLGELQVVDGRLELQAPTLGWQVTLPRVELRLRVDGDRIRAGARGWIDTQRAPLTAVADLDRDKGDGSVYLGGEPADFGAWSSLLRFAGVQALDGSGRLQLWARLHDRRVTSATVDADLRQLRLSGTPLDRTSPVPMLALPRLQARARWQADEDGWRLDAPLLRVGEAAAQQRMDGLLVAGGRRLALAGERLDVSQALAVAALGDRLSPGLRQWLLAARPQLRLRDVQLSGSAGGPLWMQGTLDQAGFAAVGDSPGLDGVRGRFHGDAQAIEFDPDVASRVRFDWPTGFGVVHEVQLAGRIVGWREGEGWQLGTPALRVQAADYAADVRGSLWFQGDGTRPWMNLAAKLDDTAVTTARKFWIHSKMSKATTDWLDAALVGGTLTGGMGLVSGDLDDWPFDEHNGRFEARGHIVRGDIKFQPDWPAMQQVDADVAFIGNGFSIAGRGELGGVAVDRFEAGIDDFAASRLHVRADSRSDAARLLEMLRQSPLRRSYADTLDNLSAAGPASATFDMLLPLGRPDSPEHRLGGQVELQGARLADKRWDLAFEQVRGTAKYSDAGFDAPALAVVHNGRVGTLALRAGSDVHDRAQAFEAELGATMDADELLDRAPELAWLKPYVEGSSPWTVAVTLPTASAPGAQAAPTRLTLRSDLAGTALHLPAPLDKPAADRLATTVNVMLPLDSGRVDVAFGRRMALAARNQGGQTGVRVVMGADHVAVEPPASGLEINGHTESLDALDWIGLARSSGKGEAPDDQAGNAISLRKVDVQVDRLLLIGGVFDDTRLQLRPQSGSILATMSGPSLAGTLNVPEADEGVITGQLQRVHWQSVAPPPLPAAEDVVITGSVLVQSLPEQTRRAAEQADPAQIPALALDIDDLRFGNITLGSASLRSRPVADGLQLDQLKLRAPKQAIDITGEWRGRGDGAHTRLVSRIDSQDIGELARNLDYGGQLRGGQGQIELDARWPGGPTAFALGNLQGQLHGDLRNGQLLEVEPGAGRVLGLLSIAQLPRRLMFDFRDFFSKGLAFNRIDGTLQFGDGLARTDRFAIEGPAADITIRGQADLRTQQYDQTVEVNPKSGNLLTVVGAVAGGPVGAAVGAAANAVLSRPLGEIGAKTYHVTGPWKEPKVDVIERDSGKARQAADPGR
ncbi:YhdP family protein [Stenotrophomonas sp. MMGLT7]|uniref:YhdP family protein n=1 Tax=Stenotrophomonas sp. MMGLT7 TaxID=2901227 RepID=UPI001E4107CF|nr:YhdP family protein [Stenotrophomonas sp. MMGLT7]MCD7099409.1 TIGR02099 family protein [Stenotrophomonas sp. MMGLT7]